MQTFGSSLDFSQPVGRASSRPQWRTMSPARVVMTLQREQ